MCRHTARCAATSRNRTKLEVHLDIAWVCLVRIPDSDGGVGRDGHGWSRPRCPQELQVELVEYSHYVHNSSCFHRRSHRHENRL